MGFLDKAVKKATEVYEVLTEDEASSKGNDFEKYVADLFNKDYFSIVEWTSDIARKRDQFVEADNNPDLVVRYQDKKRNEKFAVECKFRSDLYQGKLQWSKPDQLKRYRQYAEENSIPVFIVIGLGGEPDNPERMFCIPLEEAKYPGLYPSVFEQFERDPNKNFFWKNGYLH
jgi:hypothetical protein